MFPPLAQTLRFHWAVWPRAMLAASRCRLTHRSAADVALASVMLSSVAVPGVLAVSRVNAAAVAAAVVLSVALADGAVVAEGVEPLVPALGDGVALALVLAPLLVLVLVDAAGVVAGALADDEGVVGGAEDAVVPGAPGAVVVPELFEEVLLGVGEGVPLGELLGLVDFDGLGEPVELADTGSHFCADAPLTADICTCA